MRPLASRPGNQLEQGSSYTAVTAAGAGISRRVPMAASISCRRRPSAASVGSEDSGSAQSVQSSAVSMSTQARPSLSVRLKFGLS